MTEFNDLRDRLDDLEQRAGSDGGIDVLVGHECPDGTFVTLDGETHDVDALDTIAAFHPAAAEEY
jgi:hypothetical protein